ncbi:unnamed protein product [Bathycoccus prasinos]|jgi:hypothetical protein|tara:strand:+ start:717 stop:1448 length:732 start_codon:yes stop_codon:yes gene_type:complete
MNKEEEEEEEEDNLCTFCTFPLKVKLEEEKKKKDTNIIRLKKCKHAFHRECFKRWHVWRQKEWEREMEEMNWPKGSEEEKRAKAKPTHECPLCRVEVEERFDFSKSNIHSADDDDSDEEEEEEEKTMKEMVMSEEMLNKLRKQREVFRRKLLKAREIGALVVKDPSKTNRPLVPRSRETTQQTNGGGEGGETEGRNSDSVAVVAAVGTTTATASRGRGRGSNFLARALARARIEDEDDQDGRR